ncbi:MAG: Heavy-metal resistance [Vampirovibrio sp.]|jgi:Spy/CpxP family protein refolding chaperone|nr:Heavy-metal resistance [Vampirovibrio sp.]
MKKNIMHTALIASMAGILLTIALPASANPLKMKMQHKKEAKMKEFYQEVNATPEQRAKLDTMHTQFESQVKPLREEMWTKKKALMNYMASPNANKSEAMRREEEITQLKTKVDQLYIDHAFQKKAVLTPEQQKKAETFMQKETQKWDEKRKEYKDDGAEPKED